jgi:hypothetical protein
VAITLDKALGSASGGSTAGTAGSRVITTAATAAAASRIVVCVSWFDSGSGVFTVSDGTAYTKDLQFDNGSDHYAIFSRVLVGSLASGSSITLSWTSGISGGGILVAACSYLGTTGVDTTSHATATGTGFSSGAASNSIADALFVGGAGSEATASTVGGTNTSGTSRFDIYDSSDGQGLRMLDLIASSIASRALTGTWGHTSSPTTGALVIYKGTASAAATLVPPRPATRPRAAPAARRRPAIPTPPQAAPATWQAPEAPPLSHARLSALQAKGRRTLPTPAQITVPKAVPGNRSSSGRSKLAALRRGRARNPILTQAAPVLIWPPPRTATRRLLAAVSRSRRPTPPAEQPSALTRARRAPGTPPLGRRQGRIGQVLSQPVVLTWPPKAASAPRRVLAAVTRGRRTGPVPQPVVLVSWPPRALAAPRRLLGQLARGKRSSTPAAQQAPPVRARATRYGVAPGRAKAPPRPAAQEQPVVVARNPPRRAVLRRPRQWSAATFSQQVLPSAVWRPAKLGAARRLLAVAAHGRRSSAPVAQVPVPKMAIAARAPAGRRLAALVKARRQTPAPGQDTRPPRPPAPRRAPVLRRGRRQDPPVPAAPVLASWSPASVRRPPRALAAMLRRGRRADPAPGQDRPLANSGRPVAKGYPRGHVRREPPVSPPPPVPKWPPRLLRSLPRFGWLRRGARRDPGWPQAQTPGAPVVEVVLAPYPPVALTVAPLAPVRIVLEHAVPIAVTLGPLPAVEVVLERVAPIRIVL